MTSYDSDLNVFTDRLKMSGRHFSVTYVAKFCQFKLTWFGDSETGHKIGQGNNNRLWFDAQGRLLKAST
jgi:hypothetical protein